MERRKVLIVDDEETSRKILELAVGGGNRELLLAKDGEEALRLAREHHPDLILMDIMLPKMDGYQVVRRIKQDPALAAIPVVALTARTFDYDEDMARQAGCVDFLTKPYRLGELRVRLAKYLEG